MIRTETLTDPAPALPVLRELRDSLDDAAFNTRLKAAIDAGYQLIAAFDGDAVVGALGYRLVHDICWGQTLYVDDLVITESRRGSGIGGALMDAVLKAAQDLGCDHLRLCSGLARADAHRFYEAHGMAAFSKQFVLALNGD
ncbi:MAG: GNAT family N-acetyltransferase [Planktotalea sp.]|uniref:GNAT family N-acetyltransferase n=1 Tax=Planktotalea sp. TaxID=2029877 RepID=UPI003C77C778